MEVLSAGMSVVPGTSATLEVRLSNNAASEIRGEAQVLSPLETWSSISPWTQGFAVEPGGETIVAFDVAPPRGVVAGTYWALVKIMYFGRLLYTESDPGRPSALAHAVLGFWRLSASGRLVQSAAESTESTDAGRRSRSGVLPWGQRTEWAPLQEVGRRADELGYDSLWTWDHLYPIQGDWRGPIFEGYMTLAGWACVTSRATLGLMVGANPFRNPALTAKIVDDPRSHEQRPGDPRHRRRLVRARARGVRASTSVPASVSGSTGSTRQSS